MKVVCRRTFLDVYEESDSEVASPASPCRRNSTPWNRYDPRSEVSVASDNEYCDRLLEHAQQLTNRVRSPRNNAMTYTSYTGQFHTTTSSAWTASSRESSNSPPGMDKNASVSSLVEADLTSEMGSRYSSKESPAYVHPHRDFYKPHVFMYPSPEVVHTHVTAQSASAAAHDSQVALEPTLNVVAVQPVAAIDQGETFVIHDMPRSMSLQEMKRMIGSMGVLHACDFCYIPSHHLQKGNKRVAVGYGHVHFNCSQAAAAFYDSMHGKRLPGSQTKHSISVRRRNFASLTEAILKRRLAPHDYWASHEMHCRLML